MNHATVWSGTHYDCATIVLVMRGIAQGTPTKHLADELKLDYGTLLDRRHKIQQLALDNKHIIEPTNQTKLCLMSILKQTKCSRMLAKKAQDTRTQKIRHVIEPTNAKGAEP